ncbi:hypothetical protein [Cellulomonas sp. Y8]|uniref:hypothetical protein n=1 Tax=Cellulomonas sp. Y8 TaxID=2591145 RepID=UPI003D71E017
MEALTGRLQLRDFQMSYRLDGTTADSDRVLLDVRDGLDLTPASGVADGMTVTTGMVIGTAKLEANRAASLEEGARTSRIDQATLSSMRSFEGEVLSDATGPLDLSSGPPAVLEPGIDVVTPLTPLQSLRYASATFHGVATVETVVGQRDVACTSVWVAPSTQQDDGTRYLHCRLPARAETTSGLRAQVTLSSEVVPSALVAPLLFLDYDAEVDGYVLHVQQGDSVVEFPVVAGPTDGVVRVVETEAPVGSILVAP